MTGPAGVSLSVWTVLERPSLQRAVPAASRGSGLRYSSRPERGAALYPASGSLYPAVYVERYRPAGGGTGSVRWSAGSVRSAGTTGPGPELGGTAGSAESARSPVLSVRTSCSPAAGASSRPDSAPSDSCRAGPAGRPCPGSCVGVGAGAGVRGPPARTAALAGSVPS